MRTPPRKCTMAIKAAADVGSTSVHSSSSKPRSSTTLDRKSETPDDKGIALSSRKVQYPKQNRFCYTREELHEEYGLSLEGKLYQHLSEADVTDKDWLSVFKKQREKGSKLFLHMMRPEYVEECRLLFHKVYQAVPANREITHKFATLFVYERCPAARQDPAGRKVAWAYFGEQVLDHCKKLPGGIDKKVKNWQESNKEPSLQPLRVDSVGARGTGGQNVLFSGSTSLISASSISQQVKVQVEQMLDAKRDALKVVNTTLDTMRVELQDRNQNMWKIQGTSSAAAVLQGQLQELQILKANMKGAVDATHPDFLVVEAKVAALSSALTALGVDASSSDIRDEVDRLEKDVSDLEASASTCLQQISFCESLLEQVKAGDTMLMLPTAGQHMSHAQAAVSVPGICAACGLAFMASDVVCVYTLACGHAYHALCFAGWVALEMVCADTSCKRSIPDSVKSMLLHTGSARIPCVAPVQDGMRKVDTGTHCNDHITPAGKEESHVASEGTEGVEPSVKTVAEAQPGESSPKEDADIDLAKAAAQEGVDAVQRMIASDENPDSPIFLSDMMKASKKRKKNANVGPSKKTRSSPSTRLKQHSQQAPTESDDADTKDSEVPGSPPAVKKTPKKSTPLCNPSHVSNPPKPRVCKKL